MQFSTTLRNALGNQVGTTLGASGTLKVYTGSAPGVGNAASGTLLCTLTAVVYAAASGGAVSISATADSNAAASGTPGYYRFLTSGGTVHVEGTAGIGSGELSFNQAVSATGTVSLTSGTLTIGNA
jgi:hypothetical protein